MTDRRWAEIGRYASQVEADIHRGILEDAGIPVLEKGQLTGAFGPGFAGATMHGVRLFVPDDALDHARALIGEADLDYPDDTGEPDDAA